MKPKQKECHDALNVHSYMFDQYVQKIILFVHNFDLKKGMQKQMVDLLPQKRHILSI